MAEKSKKKAVGDASKEASQKPDAQAIAREPIPALRAGMVVRVHQLVPAGDKMRIQIYEGTIIALSGGTSQGATFTVRKISNGIGVERIFPLHSPIIKKVEILKQIKVRRAKLYYLRDYGKRLKEVAAK